MNERRRDQISRSNLSHRVHRGTAKTVTSQGARRSSSRGYLTLRRDLSADVTRSRCIRHGVARITRRLPVSRLARAAASEASRANKSRAGWRGGVVVGLLRGAVVRLVRGGRSGLTARGRVGVERARGKSMVGSRSREAAVRRDSSYHAVAYQSCLTVGVPLSFFFFPPPLS